MLLGSHVSLSGKEMFLGSVKEALSYGADTFMVYTGAPQNSKRRPLEELKIEEAKELMRASSIDKFIVHAPYIINLGNTVNEETYRLGKELLKLEVERTLAMGSDILVLHPGSAVGAPVEESIDRIIKGLDEVIANTERGYIALETMAGKGSEVGRSFEELKAIFDGVKDNSRLRICVDTCHLNDAGYDVKNDLDDVLLTIDKMLGKGVIACAHINDSMNERGARKDRHANIGKGTIGLEALKGAVSNPILANVPKCLETPYIKDEKDPKKSYAPYKEEIALLLH